MILAGQYSAELAEARQEYRAKGAEAGEFWEHDPGRWLVDDNDQSWALQAVEQPEFWNWNYLSTDYRIPINVVQTNAARAMATNAGTGHMWQDFASESYRQLPSPGPIEFFNPYKGERGEMDWFSPRHKVPAATPQGGGGPGSSTSIRFAQLGCP